MMEKQKVIANLGGTMRLGAYNCDLTEGTKSYEAYKINTISERHRHRYEFNDEYKETLVNSGLKIAGINEETGLVEIIELENHPWFVAVQFHPEFKSKPLDVHPLFRDFVSNAIKNKIKQNNKGERVDGQQKTL